MAQNHDEISFPAQQPFKEMGKLLDGKTIRQLQVRTRKESILVDLTVEFNPGEYIPRIFTAPTKAVGIWISTISRLLGVRVVVDYSEENRQAEQHEQ